MPVMVLECVVDLEGGPRTVNAHLHRVRLESSCAAFPEREILESVVSHNESETLFLAGDIPPGLILSYLRASGYLLESLTYVCYGPVELMTSTDVFGLLSHSHVVA